MRFHGVFWRAVMDVDTLNDEQWARIEPSVPGGRKGRRGPRTNDRRFVHAWIWMPRSGGRRRDLPERYGNYQTVKRRYYRWNGMGVLESCSPHWPRSPILTGSRSTPPPSAPNPKPP